MKMSGLICVNLPIDNKTHEHQMTNSLKHIHCSSVLSSMRENLLLTLVPPHMHVPNLI